MPPQMGGTCVLTCSRVNSVHLSQKQCDLRDNNGFYPERTRVSEHLSAPMRCVDAGATSGASPMPPQMNLTCVLTVHVGRSPL
jgi:hypothetical protein